MGREASLSMAGHLLLLLLPLACGFITGACRTQPQIVVVIDTDLMLPRQLAADPAAPRAASFDHVSIKMLNEKGDAIDDPEHYGEERDGNTDVSDIRREIDIAADTTWPLSFGLRPSDPTGERTARMRIRMFRSADALAKRARLSNDPDNNLTIDRLVIVTVPEDSVETVRIVLAGDCMGKSSDPTKSWSTCITRPDDLRDAREGIEQLADVDSIPPTVAGAWARARNTPCSIQAPNVPNVDAVCIQGGLGVRGTSTPDENIGDFVSSAPQHLTYLRPFFIDRREVTVRRYRAILARGALAGVVLPIARSNENPFCTWSATPGDLEDRPLNCVGEILGTAVCKADGGELPTDAQWEHTTRARHQRSTPYVWGDLPAACCSARIGTLFGCGGGSGVVADVGGPSNVSSFVDPNRCGGTSDVSIDGIFDLAGNVRELVRDSAVAYSDKECPRASIAEDPLCLVDDEPSTARGGSFRSTFDAAKIGTRSIARINADDVGFRCVYRGSGAP